MQEMVTPGEEQSVPQREEQKVIRYNLYKRFTSRTCSLNNLKM